MNYLLLSFIALFLLCSSNDRKAERVTLKCYGNTPCSACTSCNYCQHCNSGGTCGVCAKPKKETKPRESAPEKSSQCKATTKKGTRCSRSARSNGYCWQHGG